MVKWAIEDGTGLDNENGIPLSRENHIKWTIALMENRVGGFVEADQAQR